MPTNIRLTNTGRGFVRGDFRDANGDECSIQESSAASEPMLWLGQNRGSHHPARMHLTQTMVADLMPMLQHFIEHGELPRDDSTDPDDPTTIAPEVSHLMDLQEQILDAAQAAGRPELRAALASLFVCDDVGLADIAHQGYAWLVKAVRDGVGQVARKMGINGPEEGA